MEERQRQIVEGAGKDESRLNQDMIEQLKKWGPYLLMGVAVIAGGYALYNHWEQRTEKAMDDAFVAFEEAGTVGRPEDFLEVAQAHGGQGAVGVMARLSAADAWLRASRTGIPAGLQLDRDGNLPEGKAFLSDEERKAALDKAAGQYQDALGATDDSFGQASLAVGALFGLAAVSEDKGELDKARGFYTQAAERAKAAGLSHIDAVVKERLDSLDRLQRPARLYAQADLPAAAQPAQTIPVGGFTATTTSGQQIQLPSPGAAAPGTQDNPIPMQIGPDGTIVMPPAPGAAPAAPAPGATPAPTPPAGDAPKP